MGVGVSILLIAAGAILTWAVTATVSGVEIQTVGVILLIVGIVGLVALDGLLVVVGRLRRPRRPQAHVRRRRPRLLEIGPGGARRRPACSFISARPVGRP